MAWHGMAGREALSSRPAREGFFAISPHALTEPPLLMLLLKKNTHTHAHTRKNNKQGLAATLATLDKEAPRDANSISKRTALCKVSNPGRLDRPAFSSMCARLHVRLRCKTRTPRSALTLLMPAALPPVPDSQH